MSLPLTVNARFRKQPLTGVQRFAIEVTRVLSVDPSIASKEVVPENAAQGLRGHAWEQFSLPRSINGDVLLSLANTGPLAVKKQLVVIHDAAVWDQPEGFSRNFRLLYQWLLPRLAKRCRIATVSEFSRSRLSHYLGIPEESIAVFGNAIDPRFHPAQEKKENSAPYLLCVSSQDPRKNFARLLKAWDLICQRNGVASECRLKIVGAKNLFAFKETGLDTESERVEWLGRVSDEELIELYQHASGFIFPSLYEGFGIPPLEAMACGCPVAMSCETSLPEVGGAPFDQDDATSQGAVLYFDPLQEEEMAMRIEQLLSLDEETRGRLRQNALQRAAKFSWDEIGNKVIDTVRQNFS